MNIYMDTTLYYLSSTEDCTNVRYIGITCKTSKQRLKKHLSDRNYKVSYKNKWIKKVISNGFKVIITVIAEQLDYEHAKKMEIEYIREAKEVGFNLTNVSEGGEGYRGKKSPEHLLKIGAKNKGKKISDETKKKLSIAHTGKVLSPEHKEKVVSVLRRTPYTEERRLKISLSHRGKKMNEATRQKLIISNTNRIKSKEEKDKWRSKRYKPVVQLTKSGDFVNYFKSSKIVKAELGIDDSSISCICLGKTCRKTAGGYKWEYYNEEKHKQFLNGATF